MKGDTISRSAIKDQLKEYIAVANKRFVEGMLHYRKIVLDAIDNAPTVDAAPEWVSVKDRLPDKAGWYLVFRTKHTHAETAFFKGKTFPLDNHYGTITHWMPLPEPPEEKET